ncbi:glyoxalase [Brachybacterium phenoliresistens]|uniref:Glyoxalase n=1 Tax=Brachybacterium phenoliresistens TaxID=396014 RepID=Z9JXM7_9MICO|nr:VOC family protein [Brachybacterium phenoliresistens]EWS82517.1 glyoxalase [Brachybacterium phenoliresistens]
MNTAPADDTTTPADAAPQDAASQEAASSPDPVARLAMMTLDAAETAPMAAFWHGVLGWPISYQDEDYAMLTGPSSALGIGRIPDFQPPAWPDAGLKQYHLDLAVTDLEAAAARCVELGATRPVQQPGSTWIVLLDPAGHPFCLTDASAWG